MHRLLRLLLPKINQMQLTMQRDDVTWGRSVQVRLLLLLLRCCCRRRTVEEPQSE